MQKWPLSHSFHCVYVAFSPHFLTFDCPHFLSALSELLVLQSPTLFTLRWWNGHKRKPFHTNGLKCPCVPSPFSLTHAFSQPSYMDKEEGELLKGLPVLMIWPGWESGKCMFIRSSPLKLLCGQAHRTVMSTLLGLTLQGWPWWSSNNLSMVSLVVSSYWPQCHRWEGVSWLHSKNTECSHLPYSPHLLGKVRRSCLCCPGCLMGINSAGEKDLRDRSRWIVHRQLVWGSWCEYGEAGHMGVFQQCSELQSSLSTLAVGVVWIPWPSLNFYWGSCSSAPFGLLWTFSPHSAFQFCLLYSTLCTAAR